jgi:hypothetical protein
MSQGRSQKKVLPGLSFRLKGGIKSRIKTLLLIRINYE